MPRATETCSCGATFTMNSDNSESLRGHLDRWRRDHQHQDLTPKPETSWHLEAVDGR